MMLKKLEVPTPSKAFEKMARWAATHVKSNGLNVAIPTILEKQHRHRMVRIPNVFFQNKLMGMSAMVNRNVLVNALDAEFSFFKGADKSKNGLQVKGLKTVSNVAVACDAALETIEGAVAAKADLLVVHHGLLWEGAGPIRTDPLLRKRLAFAKNAGLNLYAQHLPLDAHPKLGNNVVLGHALGLSDLVPACVHDGAKVAFKGRLEKPVSLSAFSKTVAKKVGDVYAVLPFGPQMVKRVAVCSGSGGFCTSFAKTEGFDTLVVGEFKHSDYHAAKEFGVNVIEAGHYNTEVWGVQAVGRWIEARFGVPIVCVNAPTGY
ncbi:Nif3-like dinuclear metal center hexameric protein [Candidatus Micrarchaeota archaeon]|nr:Nif3-like dinuclear metal center hexameric protein [Candidatus Micrarchaeota archaeon]